MRISLSKLSFLNSLFTLILVCVTLVIIAGYEYNSFYEQKKDELKQEYIEKNKKLIQEEVNAEANRISNIIADFYFSLFSILENRVEMIENVINSQLTTHKDLTDKKLTTHIFDTIRSLSYKNSEGYNFIFDTNGVILFHSLDAKLEGVNILTNPSISEEIKKLMQSALQNGSASASYEYERDGVKRKIYTHAKKAYNFFIASSVYIDDMEKELQKNIFKALEYRRLGVDGKGYFWISTLKHIMVFHPFQKELIDRDLSDLKTKQGVYIFREIGKLFKKNDEGFITYDWNVPGETDKTYTKIAFVQKIGKWDWVLGSGFYMKDMEDSLKAEEIKQKEFFKALVQKIALILLALFVFILSISWYIAQRFEDGENRQKRYLKLLEQYKKILDLSAIVTKTDLQGRITEVNSLFEQVSGYTKEEVIGKAHKVVRHPATPKEIFEDMWKSIQSGHIWRGMLKNQSKDKERSYINKTIIFPIKNENDKIIEYISTSIDISEIVEQRDAIQNLFLTDVLTGLSSRIKLLNQINKTQIPGFLALIDIDRFTEVNDMFGNPKGDEVLKQVSKKLFELATSDMDGVYRMHADVFALYKHESDLESFQKSVKEIIKELTCRSFKVIKSDVNLTFTVGIAYGDLEVMACADMALKVAKKTKKDIVVYDQENSMISQFEENHEWMQKLSSAVQNEKIIPVFQPIYNLQEKKIEKYEVLMRYVEADGSETSPYKFIDVAKKTRLYPGLTMSIVEQAANFFKDKKEFSFSINLTLEDLLNKESMDYIYATLKQHGLCQNAILEIVESEELESFDEVEKVLKRFKSKGVQIAIDDFGSGYSNYSYLVKLDVDFIKIDGSIIKNLQEKSSADGLVSSVVQFAKKGGIKTVAEFVSSKEISDIVEKLGVDYAQGYYYGKPQKQI